MKVVILFLSAVMFAGPSLALEPKQLEKGELGNTISLSDIFPNTPVLQPEEPVKCQIRLERNGDGDPGANLGVKKAFVYHSILTSSSNRNFSMCRRSVVPALSDMSMACHMLATPNSPAYGVSSGISCALVGDSCDCTQKFAASVTLRATAASVTAAKIVE